MQPKVIALVTAFATAVPLAGWLTGNVGTECAPGGPCLLPVGFGLDAPSGAFVLGASFVLRDAVHEVGGSRAALVAIAIGGVLSAIFAAPALVVASVVAFVLAELADFAAYAPLRKRSLMLAVFLSGLAGSIVHSAIFLWLAFGSLDFIAGHVIGKAWVSLLVLAFLPVNRRMAG